MPAVVSHIAGGDEAACFWKVPIGFSASLSPPLPACIAGALRQRLRMKRRTFSLLFVTLAAFTASAFAEIKTATVTYKDGAAELEGFVAYDDAVKGPRPGVLVIHDWTGLQDYAKSRATQLAELGYVAFAADIYGKGVRPTDPKECGVQAGTYKNDLPLLRRRVMLGLDQLKKKSVPVDFIKELFQTFQKGA